MRDRVKGVKGMHVGQALLVRVKIKVMVRDRVKVEGTGEE